MAKIKGDWSGELRRAFKGAAYVYQRGNDIILAAMPTRKKRTITPKQQAAMDLMKSRSLAIKAMAPELVMNASYYAKGTALMPRDWLFMSMAGRGVSVFQPEAYITGEYSMDGIEGAQPIGPRIDPADWPPIFDKLERMYPVAALNDLSTLLDIYGDQVGTIIFRDAIGWRGLPPGLPDQALAIGGDGRLFWSSEIGRAQGVSFCPVSQFNWNTTNVATKGAQLTVTLSGELQGCLCKFEPTIGESYQVRIFERNVSQLGALRASSRIFTATDTLAVTRYMPLTAPAVVNAGETLLYLLTRLTGTGSSALPMPTCDLNDLEWPVSGDVQSIRMSTNDPQPGDAIGTTFSRLHHVAPAFIFSLQS